MPEHTGRHAFADLWGCSFDLLNSVDMISLAACTAAEEAGATVLEVTAHQFEPHGVTVLVMLAESHLSVHTWPETGQAAVDAFTCGDADPLKAVHVLIDKLDPDEARLSQVDRMASLPLP
ncbi:adenosylmethionine decarboxylase [Vulcanococcus sp.]|uniref:adenosylmethionine decarboxylase n=1 Tax=Vulcanococcus sp. TaxID=2856995 RepID=UPI003BFF2241